MQSPGSFLRTWIVSLLGFGLLVAAFNLVVDPYDVFGTPRLAGISRLKPAAKKHAMLAKVHQEARARPVTVLIGSSSTHIGLDAADPKWPAAMRPVYNYGIPGSYATSVSLRTLQDAIAGGGVQNAIVCLDYQNFLAPEGASDQFRDDEERYRVTQDGRTNPRRQGQMVRDMFLSVATLGALTDSVITVLSQGRASTLNLAPDGSSTEADFINAARADGMHDLFAQKDVFEEETAAELKPVMATWHGPLPNLDIVADMIRYANEHGVKLTLVLTPHHADALEIYWRAGLWPRIEQLKTELAAMTAATGGKVALWDFMDYSSFSTEQVPPAGDRRHPTSWFWEPTHFKKQLGEVMIERMFGETAPDFGVKLTPQNVAERNAAVRKERLFVVCRNDGGGLLSSLGQHVAADDCPRIGTLSAHRDPM